MLWDLQGDGASQYINSWTTAIKLAWNCPRATRSYLVQEVLACGYTSAKADILARYGKFFKGLRTSPCWEVTVLANLVARMSDHPLEEISSMLGNLLVETHGILVLLVLGLELRKLK